MVPDDTASPRQRFHRNFIWRSTGFPLELLEQFGMDNLAEDVRRVLASSPAARPGRLSERLPSAAASRFQTEFRSLRRQLHRVAGGAQVQMAVASSSPPAARRLRFEAGAADAARTSALRRRERLAIRYLQRLTTKCETSAFFGPVATGSFTRTAARVDVSHDGSSYRGTAFLAERFLATILRRLRSDPLVLAELSIRRRSGVVLAAPDLVVDPRRPPLRLGPQAVRLLAAIARPTPVRTIVDQWPGPEEDALTTVFALIELGLVSDTLEAAWHSRDPFRILRSHALRSSARDELTALLDLLEDAAATWPRDSAEAKGRALEAVTAAAESAGLAMPAAGASFYGGHLPLFEDGFAPGVRLRLDHAWAEPFLHDLERVVRASLAADASRAAGLRRGIARQLADEGVHALSLPDFLRRDRRDDAAPCGAAASAATQAFGPVITSPDVLIAAADLDALRNGDGHWVLSECHSSVSAAAFFVRTLPQSAAWLRGIDRFLAGRFPDSLLVSIAAARANKTAFSGVLAAARYLETGLSAPPEAATIALSDMEVRADEDVELVERGSGRPVVLMPGNLGADAPRLDCFRTPRFAPLAAETTARAADGRVVYRRARWTLGAEAMPPPRGADALEVFCWAQALRMAYGLPRWLFARPASERKPLCIDLSNPFLCEELHALLDSEPELEVEEMYPAPGDAWLKGPGGRYLGELRLLYASEGRAT